MKELVIVGAGELAKEIVWLIDEINMVRPKYVIRGFIDKDEESINRCFCGYRILGTEDWLKQHMCELGSYISPVIAIQDPEVRKAIYGRNSYIEEWETLIHPSAVVASTSRIGKGSVVFPYVSISADTIIGDFCLCYLNSSIGNDCAISNFVSILSTVQVSEHVKIGEKCILKARSCIAPFVELSNSAVISAGSVVGA